MYKSILVFGLVNTLLGVVFLSIDKLGLTTYAIYPLFLSTSIFFIMYSENFSSKVEEKFKDRITFLCQAISLTSYIIAFFLKIIL